MTTHEVCLLLGSNIQPEKNLEQGLELLGQQVNILRCSSAWETPAIGSDGPDYLNLAVLITTTQEAGNLKENILRPLEAKLGRVRNADKNAPRTIDIDMITYDDQVVDPSLWHYAHRAVPVAEVLPEVLSEAGEPIVAIAARLAEVTSIRRKPGIPAYRIK